MATPGPRLSEKNNNEKRYLSAIGTISERSAAKRGGDNDSRARAQEQPKCEPRQGDLAEGAQKWLQNAAALDDKHFASSADAPQGLPRDPLLRTTCGWTSPQREQLERPRSRRDSDGGPGHPGQSSEPRHVKYATLMAKNLRRSSHRALGATTARQGAVVTGLSPEERRELIRTQREVIWNLQRDGVVTVVRPGDDPVPYKRQGNPSVNTPQSVRLRYSLRKAPLIQEIINEYWCFPGLKGGTSSEMSKESYMELNRKLHLALVPDANEEEEAQAAQTDWFRDTGRWEGRMTKEAFFSSMFELADIWTENIGEEEYTAFLWLLLETITNTAVVPPSFKDDREIECLVDKDLDAVVKNLEETTPKESSDGIGYIDPGEEASVPVPVGPDAETSAIAVRREPGAMLSPKLKERHVQRLRALRERLQALKQLRHPPPGAPDTEGTERNGVVVEDVAAAEEEKRMPDVDRSAPPHALESPTLRNHQNGLEGPVAASGAAQEAGPMDSTVYYPTQHDGTIWSDGNGRHHDDISRSPRATESGALSVESKGDQVPNQIARVFYLPEGDSNMGRPGDGRRPASVEEHAEDQAQRQDIAGSGRARSLQTMRDEENNAHGADVLATSPTFLAPTTAIGSEGVLAGWDTDGPGGRGYETATKAAPEGTPVVDPSAVARQQPDNLPSTYPRNTAESHYAADQDPTAKGHARPGDQTLYPSPSAQDFGQQVRSDADIIAGPAGYARESSLGERDQGGMVIPKEHVGTSEVEPANDGACPSFSRSPAQARHIQHENQIGDQGEQDMSGSPPDGRGGIVPAFPRGGDPGATVKPGEPEVNPGEDMDRRDTEGRGGHGFRNAIHAVPEWTRVNPSLDTVLDGNGIGSDDRQNGGGSGGQTTVKRVDDIAKGQEESPGARKRSEWDEKVTSSGRGHSKEATDRAGRKAAVDSLAERSSPFQQVKAEVGTPGVGEARGSGRDAEVMRHGRSEHWLRSAPEEETAGSGSREDTRSPARHTREKREENMRDFATAGGVQTSRVGGLDSEMDERIVVEDPGRSGARAVPQGPAMGVDIGGDGVEKQALASSPQAPVQQVDGIRGAVAGEGTRSRSGARETPDQGEQDISLAREERTVFPSRKSSRDHDASVAKRARSSQQASTSVSTPRRSGGDGQPLPLQRLTPACELTTQRLRGSNDGFVSSAGRPASTRQKPGANAPHFRPAGRTEGWDGILRVSDEQWKMMISKAKEQRQHSSRPHERRTVSREGRSRRDRAEGHASSAPVLGVSPTSGPHAKSTNGGRDGRGRRNSRDDVRTGAAANLPRSRGDHTQDVLKSPSGNGGKHSGNDQGTARHIRPDRPRVTRHAGEDKLGKHTDSLPGGVQPEPEGIADAPPTGDKVFVAPACGISPTSPKLSGAETGELGSLADERPPRFRSALRGVDPGNTIGAIQSGDDVRSGQIEDTVEDVADKRERHGDLIAAGVNLSSVLGFRRESKLSVDSEEATTPSHQIFEADEPQTPNSRSHTPGGTTLSREGGAVATSPTPAEAILGRLQAVFVNHNLRAEDILGSEFSLLCAPHGSASRDASRFGAKVLAPTCEVISARTSSLGSVDDEPGMECTGDMTTVDDRREFDCALVDPEITIGSPEDVHPRACDRSTLRVPCILGGNAGSTSWDSPTGSSRGGRSIKTIDVPLPTEEGSSRDFVPEPLSNGGRWDDFSLEREVREVDGCSYSTGGKSRGYGGDSPIRGEACSGAAHDGVAGTARDSDRRQRGNQREVPSAMMASCRAPLGDLELEGRRRDASLLPGIPGSSGIHIPSDQALALACCHGAPSPGRVLHDLEISTPEDSKENPSLAADIAPWEAHAGFAIDSPGVIMDDGRGSTRAHERSPVEEGGGTGAAPRLSTRRDSKGTILEKSHDLRAERLVSGGDFFSPDDDDRHGGPIMDSSPLKTPCVKEEPGDSEGVHDAHYLLDGRGHPSGSADGGRSSERGGSGRLTPSRFIDDKQEANRQLSRQDLVQMADRSLPHVHPSTRQSPGQSAGDVACLADAKIPGTLRAPSNGQREDLSSLSGRHDPPRDNSNGGTYAMRNPEESVRSMGQGSRATCSRTPGSGALGVAQREFSEALLTVQSDIGRQSPGRCFVYESGGLGTGEREYEDTCHVGGSMKIGHVEPSEHSIAKAEREEWVKGNIVTAAMTRGPMGEGHRLPQHEWTPSSGPYECGNQAVRRGGANVAERAGADVHSRAAEKSNPGRNDRTPCGLNVAGISMRSRATDVINSTTQSTTEVDPDTIMRRCAKDRWVAVVSDGKPTSHADGAVPGRAGKSPTGAWLTGLARRDEHAVRSAGSVAASSTLGSRSFFTAHTEDSAQAWYGPRAEIEECTRPESVSSLPRRTLSPTETALTKRSGKNGSDGHAKDDSYDERCAAMLVSARRGNEEGADLRAHGYDVHSEGFHSCGAVPDAPNECCEPGAVLTRSFQERGQNNSTGSLVSGGRTKDTRFGTHADSLLQSVVISTPPARGESLTKMGTIDVTGIPNGGRSVHASGESAASRESDSVGRNLRESKTSVKAAEGGCVPDASPSIAVGNLMSDEALEDQAIDDRDAPPFPTGELNARINQEGDVSVEQKGYLSTENSVVALARRIADADGTGYEAVMREVREALHGIGEAEGLTLDHLMTDARRRTPIVLGSPRVTQEGIPSGGDGARLQVSLDRQPPRPAGAQVSSCVGDNAIDFSPSRGAHGTKGVHGGIAWAEIGDDYGGRVHARGGLVGSSRGKIEGAWTPGNGAVSSSRQRDRDSERRARIEQIERKERIEQEATSDSGKGGLDSFARAVIADTPSRKRSREVDAGGSSVRARSRGDERYDYREADSTQKLDTEESRPKGDRHQQSFPRTIEHSSVLPKFDEKERGESHGNGGPQPLGSDRTPLENAKGGVELVHNGPMSGSGPDDASRRFSPSRRRGEQALDTTRPELWRPGRPASSSLGWRDPPLARLRESPRGEHEPLYVDAKQVRYYPPELGLPPWRSPAPGEPGWEPILNYCEVRRDEAKESEERKRRDYLCRQRYRNRGQAEGDQTPSSLDKNREISPRRSGSILHAGNHAPVEEEVVSEGADEHGYPPPRTAIARRVNGEASMEVLGHEIDESEVVAEDAMMHNHPRVYQTAREAMEGEGDRFHQSRSGIGGIHLPAGKPQSSGSPGDLTDTGGRLNSRHEDEGFHGDLHERTTAGVRPATVQPLASVGGALLQTRRPSTVWYHACSPTLSSARFTTLETATTGKKGPHEQIQYLAAPTRTSQPDMNNNGEAQREAGTRIFSEFIDTTNDRSLALQGKTELKQAVASKRAEGPDALDYGLHAPWQLNRRRAASLDGAASSIASAYMEDAAYDSTVPHGVGNQSVTRRHSESTTTALSQSRQHRRESALLQRQMAAISAGTPPHTNSLMVVSGSRWSKSVLLQQQQPIYQRTRLVPATRTAYGRRGSNRGRLGTLLGGEKKYDGQWVLDLTSTGEGGDHSPAPVTGQASRSSSLTT